MSGENFIRGAQNRLAAKQDRKKKGRNDFEMSEHLKGQCDGSRRGGKRDSRRGNIHGVGESKSTTKRRGAKK